jgi:hypothetical protein
MIARMHDPHTTQWLTLATALNRTMKEHAPGWTDHNQHDPGVTIIELMAFLAENLAIYSTDPDRGAAAVSRIIRALEAYQQSPSDAVDAHEHWCGALRPRFFPGQMLTADDLRDEQEYQRERRRRHLRTLHGFGVVNGFDVARDDDGWTIHVEPGHAIDSEGNEICLHEKATLTLPAHSSAPHLVVVQHAERLVRPVPLPSGDGTEPSRIEEGCRVMLSAAGCEAGVEIACLVREADAWHLDPSFAPVRVVPHDRPRR